MDGFSQEEVDFAIGRLIELHTELSSDNGSSLTPITLIGLVPLAMEQAARIVRLNGAQRGEFAVAVAVGVVRALPDSAFADPGESKRVARQSHQAAIEFAEAAAPALVDALYAAYRRRHVFRQRLRSLRQMFRGCRCRC